MSVYDEIQAEREHQDFKWGPDHDDRHLTLDWSSFLIERLSKFMSCRNFPTQRRALVELTALGVACIESIDRRTAGIAPLHTGQPNGEQSCDDPDCPRCGVPKHE